MTEPAKFWDKHAAKYAASKISDMAAYQKTLERTKSHLKESSHVFEIGCGTGSTALELAPGVAGYSGTDISPKMIEIAQRKASEAGISGLSFSVAAADALNVPKPCDTVLGFNIFHLTQDTEKLFARIFAALPQGGLFISKTACLAEPSIGVKRFAFAGLIPIMRMIGVAPFVSRLTFAGLESRITTAGFEIIETVTGPAMSRYIVARKT